VSKTSRSNGAGTEHLKKLERLGFRTFLRLVPPRPHTAALRQIAGSVSSCAPQPVLSNCSLDRFNGGLVNHFMPAETAPFGGNETASSVQPTEKKTSPMEQGSRGSISSRPWWMWWGLFIAVATILFFRQPQAIKHAFYFGEDGKIFFKQQYENGFLWSLFHHYAGYLHFVPRTVAGICSFIPLEYNPTAYAVICLLTASAIFTFFFAAGFRSVIESDLLRAVVVLMFTVMPNSESLMRLAYLNWYFAFFVALLTVYELPKKPFALWLLFVPAALAAWSSPQIIVCLPLIVWRGCLAGERDKRIWWALLALAVIGFLLTAQNGSSALSKTLQQPHWGRSLRHAIGFRVFDYFFLGEALSQNLPANGWNDVGRLSLFLATACVLGVVSAIRKPRIKDWRSLVPMTLFYLTLASAALFVLRARMVPDFLGFSDATWFGGGRYFFTATLLLCVLSGLVFEKVILPQIKATWVLGTTLILFCLWLDLHSARFALEEWHTDRPWKYYTQQIRAAEERVQQSGGSETVHVATTFKPFDFDLVITPATAARDAIGRPSR
jgi:hypothetical protein